MDGANVDRADQLNGAKQPFGANMPDIDMENLQTWLDAVRWFGGGEATIERMFALIGSWNEKVLWLAVSAQGDAYNVPIVLTNEGPIDAADHPAGQRALLALSTGSEDVATVAVKDATVSADGTVGVSTEGAAGVSTEGAVAAVSISGAGNGETAASATADVESDASLVSAPRGESPGFVNAHRLTGEQSNTSVIYELADSSQAIVKIFRILSPGQNPDVFLTGALSDSGTVPRLLGSARMEWAGLSADVLVAQEFLAGSQDAWRTVTATVPGGDATDSKRPSYERESIERLGALTRRIHEELAARCGTIEADEENRARLRRAWIERADEAVALVPGLAAHRGRIDALYAATETLAWPPLQRIHGDYHLGQVLDAPGRGWVALDFEGEPLRPLADRTQPDLAVRDVAGMIRSFGYAAGMTRNHLAYAHDRPDPSGIEEHEVARIKAWEEAAVAAFLHGYGELGEAENILLNALILDKALYELAYEAAQRPDWLEIPLAGVARILDVDPDSIDGSPH